ncbi:hypothetical protein SAMN04488058_10588 [Deinococcus reticulitermitis]|uniref:Uncharacterized protein n=1 Tax=Deinococcus reticulitermitis TaxID=856736 RepID=A0A1H6XH44_9DEIO|nr:hypothetical protein [Deinococcus reticulitermitis]SEJ24190.1 hypothetical protein SAMN04488058_10588 [Deinococcus reticulitermitis]
MVSARGERLRPDKRVRPVNPPGYLATQDLKDRGWTPRLIARFLGEHDLTRENGLRMGRRRLPPVKLYLETRVDEAEREDTFLAAQARAADARERAARSRERRAVARAARLRAAAETYLPVVEPQRLRKGATRKARAPHLPGLEALQAELERALGQVTPGESAQLRALLLDRLDLALSLAYDWFPAPGQGKGQAAAPRPGPGGDARPSDWREWDWD